MGLRRVGWFPRLLVATVFVSFASSLVRPMLSYQTLAVGGNAADIGLVAAASGVLPLLATVPVGRMVDRYGARSFIAGGLAVQAAGTGLFATSGAVWQLAVLNAFVGLGGTIHIVGTQAMLAMGKAATEHDRRFGLSAVAVSTGQFLGPVLGGLIADRSGTVHGTPATAPSLLVAAAVLIVGTAIVLRLPASPDPARPPRPGRSTGDRPGMSQILRTPGIGQVILAGIAVVVATDLLAVYLPLLGQQHGIGAGAVGVLLGLRAGASVVSRLLVATLVRRVGRRRLLILSTLSAAAALMLLLPLLANPAGLAVLIVLAGFFLGLCQPLTQTWVVQLVAQQARGTALALRLTGNRAAGIAIPAIAGLLSGAAGATAVIILLTSLLAATGLAALTTRQPTHNGPAGGTTPTATS